jgi:hypothetical protein
MQAPRPHSLGGFDRSPCSSKIDGVGHATADVEDRQPLCGRKTIQIFTGTGG